MSMTYAHFEIKPHAQSRRLFHFELDRALLRRFFLELSDVNVQNLEYVPYMRFMLADTMMQLFGTELQTAIRHMMNERHTGGFVIGVQGQSDDPDDFVKFGTAIAHIIGIPNPDSMTGTFYARFSVQDTDRSDSYLRQAYRTFTLHTDGTFVDEPTDWLLMMKMAERNAVGGESRLLHLDDWEELDSYSNHPYARVKTTFKSPPSKNVGREVQRRIFFDVNDKPCICFIDQFAYPESMEQARYFQRLVDSLENCPATFALNLSVGHVIVLNNRFWLHGRAAFEKHPELYRELMRQRGRFANS